MSHHIVVTNPVHAEVAARLAALGSVDINPSQDPWSPAELAERLDHATVLLGFMTDRVDAEVLASAPRLQLVACALKGFDNYDVTACTEAGVWVSIVPDLLTEPTAELAVCLAIGLARQVRQGDALVRSGNFRGWRPQLYGTGLAGATVAVVGMGAVGRAIVSRLQGFGCERLWGVDPDVTDTRVESVSLEQALAHADYVFLAAPLVAGSHHLINASRLASVRDGQLLINVGRGSVVDEAAVAHALAEGRLGGYAADVFAFEDWAWPGRPRAIPPALLAQRSTLFTPHLGSAVRSVRLAIEHRAVDNIEALVAGCRPPDAINTPSCDGSGPLLRTRSGAAQDGSETDMRGAEIDLMRVS